MINFKVGLLMRLLEHGTISDKLMHVHIAFSNYLLTFWISYRSGSVWNLHGRCLISLYLSKVCLAIYSDKIVVALPS